MPPENGAEEARLAAETWAARRVSLAGKFSTDGLKEFVGTSEAMARRVIHGIGSQDPEVYDALAELATIAGGVLTRRKVFVNGQDKTPPR
jgi:hypothetical protein